MAGVWWTPESSRCVSSQKAGGQYYAVHRFRFSSSRLKWEEVFRHLTQAYQDLCIALALLCPVYHIPHFTFVRILWHSPTSLCADLLWAWCWLPFSLKQRHLQEGLLSSHSAYICNILLSDISLGKLFQVKSKRLLLLVLFRNFCYLLVFCMLQQPSVLGSIEKDPCMCEFLT